MLRPNDLPLLCLPTDLSDEAAAKLVGFLHELTDALQRHYCAHLRRYHHETAEPTCKHDQRSHLDPESNDPPF
jgi:hypothetical protein